MLGDVVELVGVVEVAFVEGVLDGDGDVLQSVGLEFFERAADPQPLTFGKLTDVARTLGHTAVGRGLTGYYCPYATAGAGRG